MTSKSVPPRKSFLDRFLDSQIMGFGTESHVVLRIVIFVIFFSACTITNASMIFPDQRGLVSLLQGISCILLAQTAGKRGFWTILIMNGLQVISVLGSIIVRHDNAGINGLMMTLVALIIVIIMLAYTKRIQTEINRNLQKTKALEEANAKLEEREKETSRQNTLLMDYNRAMKENEERLYRLNHYDTLTGLPNRVKIIDRMELLISLLSHKRMPFALVYVDLDNFKQINDTMGHHVGDLMLQTVAARLKNMVHDDDMLGRWGGDEFALLIQRQMKEEEILTYVESVRDSLSEMFTVEDSEYKISASFGISLFPSDGLTATDLMKCAETAMYKAKEYGKNMVQFYRKEMKDDILRRIKYESKLLSSISNEELYLVYQPQYDTRTKELRGFEALARWKSPKFGEVSPVEFIPVAEDVGFIVPLGEWVLEAACRKVSNIRQKYDWDITMSVNISAVQLMSPSFVQSVKRILSKTQCDPKNLEFEVTESVMVSSVEYVVKVLHELRSMGIAVALDDFGTGYSSLNYLNMLPIKVLKLDKVFIDDMAVKDTQRLMVGSIIGLVHQIDMKVVAEGVDDPVQLELLEKYNCDYIQGYIWGRPLTDSEVSSLLIGIRKSS
ncbi:MAG TPA: EAL domain-containing protein [Bacillota bacterium]|nr:EAL domain-containing protein [Bacillota bacterium]HPE38944.1 EAL domain-containing protein [Bacillota bacterium]